MNLDRCFALQTSLIATIVVIVHVFLDHFNETFSTDKLSPIIFSRLSIPQKPSIGPLSVQRATRDILCFIFAFFSFVQKLYLYIEIRDRYEIADERLVRRRLLDRRYQRLIYCHFVADDK